MHAERRLREAEAKIRGGGDAKNNSPARKECPLKRVFEERPNGYENVMKNTKRMHAMFKKVVVKSMPQVFRLRCQEIETSDFEERFCCWLENCC